MDIKREFKRWINKNYPNASFTDAEYKMMLEIFMGGYSLKLTMRNE